MTITRKPQTSLKLTNPQKKSLKKEKGSRVKTTLSEIHDHPPRGLPSYLARRGGLVVLVGEVKTDQHPPHRNSYDCDECNSQSVFGKQKSPKN